ncbi:MAG TPA: SdrD B-like domain-containing protein, partial [Thermoanaerobaculia bacterium]|nr:SdrD B-like domain-containing protein [Thermoanaerobaculia bacterium]
GQVSLVSPGSIGDRVWKDANANGIQDASELGLAGVTVTLRRGAATVASVTTDSTGVYSFGNLIPGSYSIVFGRPAGWTWTLANQGADDGADSDADASGATGVFDLAAGQSDTSRDAGFVPVPVTASVGNFVWNDLDGDGIQDGDEPGIAGVTVRLYAQTTGTVVGETTTDTLGGYAFSGFAGNRYYFLEFVLPGGFVFTVRDVGGDTVDSDVDVSTGRTVAFNIAAGATQSYWDAGMLGASPASLGDKVWLDADGDGLKDGDEPGLADITVRLYKAPSALVSTTTTAAGGLYGFSNLAPGDYVLEVVKPTGYSFSPKDQGGDDTLDSDVDTSTGRTAAFALAGGTIDTTRDAGLVSAVLGSIGDRVWVDADADGLQDAGEASLPGVTVRLYTSGGSLVGLTTTGADGLYRLGSLISGSYYLEFVLPAGYAFTAKDAAGDTADSDADPATGRTATFNLAAGESTTAWDAGLVPLVADLSVTKTGPATVSRGAGLTFTIVVANAGPGNAPNVTLTDPTPAGLVFASASAPCSGGFPCALGTLNSGGSQSVTVAYTVPADYAGSDPIVNVASVSATTQDPSPSSNQATSAIPVDRPPTADLGVTKTGPPSAAQGSTVSWTVVVHNGGSDHPPNSLPPDPTPTGLTFHSASAPFSGGVPCYPRTLNAGASRTVTATHSIPADYVAPDPIQNTASVSSDATDGNPANDSATASTPLGANPADVRVVKSGPAEAAAGTDLTYTIAVSNAGPGPAANVVLDDPTPSGLAFVSADPPCASGFPCSLGTLVSGASVTLTATFSVPTGYTTPNPVVNTATVSSTTADPVPGNNGSSVSSGIACGAVTGSVTGGGTACAGTPSVVIVTVA